MHRLMTAAIVAATLLSLVPAAAEDQFAITPPTGWVQADGPTGVLGLWVTPTSAQFRQNINLVAEPYAGSLADYVAQNREALSSAEKDLRFGPEADTKTCGVHPAHFMTWEATLAGHDLLFEQMMSVWDGRGYVLTYTRQSGEPELDSARAALTTLCIRSI